MQFCFAYLTIAFEIGCSLKFSADATSSNSFSLKFELLTLISPLLIVPVLSNATNLASFISSKTSGFFTKIPAFAPRERELTIAIGVASPSAHGHEMISTQIALEIA